MQKKMVILSVFFQLMIFAIAGICNAQPKISNFDISPKEIGPKAEITISFDYENVEGGLKEGRAFLIQKFQFPGEERLITRTSNWQGFLTDLSAYPSTSGRVERKFINPDVWKLNIVELTYELKIVDKNGRESNTLMTKIMPKR